MAETLPSPPRSRNSSPSTSINTKEDLLAKLDNLLEQYLELLDQYDKSRKELSQQLSSGFFSLAQAQRTSNLGMGRRYGQNFYDERMKAIRRTRITQHQRPVKKNAISSFVFEVIETDQKKTDVSNDVDETSEQSIDALNNLKLNEALSNGKETRSETSQSTAVKHRDPLKWFGVLTPPALRQTQTQFANAVEGSVPTILNVVERMAPLEIQITQMRKEISTMEKIDSDSDTG